MHVLFHLIIFKSFITHFPFVLFFEFQGIARRLVKAALKIASRKRGVTYDHVKSTTDPNFRRNIHDDITVVVIFFNQGGTYDAAVPGLSIRGTKNENLPARFNLQGVMNARS